MMAWGGGITMCGFCRRKICFTIEGTVLKIEGKETHDGLPLFCSEFCEAAWRSGLDARVDSLV